MYRKKKNGQMKIINHNKGLSISEKVPRKIFRKRDITFIVSWPTRILKASKQKKVKQDNWWGKFKQKKKWPKIFRKLNSVRLSYMSKNLQIIYPYYWLIFIKTNLTPDIMLHLILSATEVGTIILTHRWELK